MTSSSVEPVIRGLSWREGRACSGWPLPVTPGRRGALGPVPPAGLQSPRRPHQKEGHRP